MVISIAILLLARDWKIQSKVINYFASSAFGVYLIHMYPLMMDLLFLRNAAVFDLSRYISNPLLPVYSICGISMCILGCVAIETIRKVMDRTVSRGIRALRKKERIDT